MANPVFNIITHTVPCQHIREYAFAIDDEQETELSLAVKQYIPRSNPNPKKGDITIIGAHATGFGKVRRNSRLALYCQSEDIKSTRV